MSFDLRILADADHDGEGRTVEVRLTAWRSPEEDPLEDSRWFAAGDRHAILRFTARLLEQGAQALPLGELATCRRCDLVGNPEDEGERRRPFVCRRCQEEASRHQRHRSPAFRTEGVEALFLGTGDAFGSSGQRQSAVLLTARNAPRGVLLDAGPGCHSALRAEGLSNRDLAVVVLSHFHGDHYGGLPFIELDAFRTSRRAPLLVLAPPGARERIRSLRRCLYPSLEVRFSEEIREVLPGEEVVLPAAVGGGSAVPFRAAHQADRWALSWKLRLGDRTVVYSGDSALTERMLRKSANSDLLIHECTGLQPLPGHTSHTELKAAASRIGARRVLLVHTGTDVRQARDPVFEPAHDGLRVMI